MHRLPPAIAVAVFDRPHRARILQATRFLDGRLTFHAHSVTLSDAPLLTDRLGLAPDTLVFTRSGVTVPGRDTIWRVPDTSDAQVDLTVDVSLRTLRKHPDARRILGAHPDHVLPGLVMAVVLGRLAMALRLPCLAEDGTAELVRWLPSRPAPLPPPPRIAPPTSIALAFERARFSRKG